MNTLISETQFARDVRLGLTSQPKYLLSKYFYDDEGSRLFAEIMKLPEYYLTTAEHEIYRLKSDEMISGIEETFHVIELGPGNGVKSTLFLTAAEAQGKLLSYYPIDISGDALKSLYDHLRREIKSPIHPVEEEYMRGLEKLKRIKGRRVVIFMGSNIGNLSHDETNSFFRNLYNTMAPDDLLLIGFDLRKDPELILAAYNDKMGVTRDFNLNLLYRINRELGADFSVGDFKHYPTYDPVSGYARSFLVSMKEQAVRISALDMNVIFDAYEPIHVEVSRKYDVSDMAMYGESNGFTLKQVFKDSKGYFANALFTRV